MASNNSERYQSLAEFWPYYLSEHRVAADRVLHFLGTTWFFIFATLALVQAPGRMAPVLLGVLAIGWIASTRIEARRPAFREIVSIFLLLIVGHPILMPIGLVGAYFLSWCGHFGIEHNKPAAFRYPVWSFISDFRVCGLMATGRMWSGDPLAGASAATTKSTPA